MAPDGKQFQQTGVTTVCSSVRPGLTNICQEEAKPPHFSSYVTLIILELHYEENLHHSGESLPYDVQTPTPLRLGWGTQSAGAGRRTGGTGPGPGLRASNLVGSEGGPPWQPRGSRGSALGCGEASAASGWAGLRPPSWPRARGSHWPPSWLSLRVWGPFPRTCRLITVSPTSLLTFLTRVLVKIQGAEVSPVRLQTHGAGVLSLLPDVPLAPATEPPAAPPWTQASSDGRGRRRCRQAAREGGHEDQAAEPGCLGASTRLLTRLRGLSKLAGCSVPDSVSDGGAATRASPKHQKLK